MGLLALSYLASMKPLQPSLWSNWPALLAGVISTLVGVGLARFAYTPLIPVVIEAQWFSASDAVYLGAANLLGYLFGALSAHRLASRFSARVVILASLLMVAFSFLFCSYAAGFYWFFGWRVLAGFAGALLMVVTPSIVLASTPMEHRAVVGTMVFTGVGLGAVLSAMVVPALLSLHLAWTWLSLGLFSLLLAWLCDLGVRRLPEASVGRSSRRVQQRAGGHGGATQAPVLILVVVTLMAAYAMDAVGFLPHTVFWVDYLVRQEGFGQAAASFQWGLFGLGALFGPFLVGLMVRFWGWHQSLCIAFALKALAVLLPVISLAFWSQSWSSLVVGALSPGITALLAGRMLQLVGVAAQQRFWGYTTALFATTQVAAGYAMSAFYVSYQTYVPLYVLGSAALVAGLLLVILSRWLQQRASAATA